MPRFEKGSKEAKEWAMKMRQARDSKKGAPSKTHPGDMDYTTKKGDKVFHEKGHYVKKSRKPYMTGGDVIREMPIPMEQRESFESYRNRMADMYQSLANTFYEDRESDEVVERIGMPTYMRIGTELGRLNEVISRIRDSTTNIQQVEAQMRRASPIIERIQNLFRGPMREPTNLAGGWLQPGEIPLAATSEAMIAEKEVDAPVELSAEEFITDDIAGSGMCGCRRCGMCGGALMSNPDNQYVPMLQAQLQKARFNSGEVVGGKVNIGKAFKKAGKTLTKGFAKAGEVLNPMTYALGNKTTRDAMIASGEFTHDYALPAVVSAGLPVYYGVAGTAGAMLGGPLGAMAATKGADMLWQNMVAKPGYDPRQNQKSKTLGVVSGELGKLGASQLKAGISGKTKAPASKDTAPKNGGVSQAGKGMRKKKKKLIIIE